MLQKDNIVKLSSHNKIKIFIKIILDFLLTFPAIYLAILIDFEKIIYPSLSILFLAAFVGMIQVSTLYFLKSYSDITIYFGTKNILNLILSLLIVCLILFIINLIPNDESKIFYRFLKIKILFIYCFLYLLFSLFVKIFLKELNNHFNSKNIQSEYKNIVIYGAGQTGFEIMKIIENFKNYKLIFFVDDNKNKIGRTINGIKILSQNAFEQFKNKIDLVLICIPSAESFKIIEMEKVLTKYKIKFKNISSIENFLSHHDNLNIKNINYSPKETVLNNQFDKIIKKNFYNKKILITGAAGSIGKELAFQIFKLNVKSISILDFNEFSLSKIKNDFELIQKNKKIQIQYFLINLTNKELLNKILDNLDPDIIFHAAAYKHVDIVEENIISCVSNNVLSLLNLTEFFKNKKNKTFTFISTDKAVKPLNYMGKSKRLGEIIVSSLSNMYPKNYFNCVRFGNVVGSSGSLIPKVYEQIRKGGPVTVTNKYATRYFMSISDAVNLTIQASGNKENNGKIYVLKMGDPININSLVKNIIKDHDVNKKIKIKYIGLRPGEKIHEELFYDEKKISDINNIYVEECKTKLDVTDFLKIKNKIIKANKTNDKLIINDLFKEYL